VKQIARSTIARLGPKDLACIVFPQGERDAADFTSDRARLLAAVERYRPRAGGAQMWNVIRDVSAALAAAPQRRKAIILIAKGFTLDLFTTPGNALTAARSGGAAWEEAIANSTRAAEVLGTAHSSMISIYPIDPNGLEAPSAADIRSGTAFPGQERRDAMMMLAGLTGGRAVVNTNDFEPGLTQIFRENSSYYLLGYTPENHRSDGKYRRLEVRVKREGLRVMARRGYYEPRAVNAKNEKPAAPVDETGLAIAGPLPKGDLLMQATAAAFPSAGSSSPVAIAVWLQPPADPNARSAREDVEVLVEAFTLDGKRQHSVRETVQAGPGLGATSRLGAEVLSRIDMKPGRYQVRMGAHSPASGRTGSVYFDIDVPDPSRDGVTLSDIALGLTPGPAIVPKDGLRDLLPLTPTAVRTFSRSNRVKAFLSVHQGGKGGLMGLPMTVSILDSRGSTVFEARETLETGQFTVNRTSGYLFDLPLTRLQPGPHLLTVQVQNGPAAAAPAAVRNLRFSVQ
jgi:VWFA-related protein